MQKIGKYLPDAFKCAALPRRRRRERLLDAYAASALHNVELPYFPSDKCQVRFAKCPVSPISWFYPLRATQTATLSQRLRLKFATPIRRDRPPHSWKVKERALLLLRKPATRKIGEWSDAMILGRYWDVPDDLAAYTLK